LSASGYRVSASAASGSTDWARLVIVEEPEHWPESLMADIARLDPAAVRVNALECRAGRFLVAFHNGDAVGFHPSHQPAHFIGVRGRHAGTPAEARRARLGAARG
jgi:hypothetical protein